MNTMQESKVIEAVSVSGEALQELLTGVITHADIKSDTPVLNSVRIATLGGSLIAEATDRYRLVRGAIDVFIVQDESGTLAESVISAAEAKQVINLCKSLSKRQAVTITRAGDLISFSSAGNSVTLNALSVNMPNFDQFLEPVNEPAQLSELRFNPKFFADLAKLCGKRAGFNGVKVTFGVAANKPYQFTIEGESVTYRGAIMPMKGGN